MQTVKDQRNFFVRGTSYVFCSQAVS